MDSPGWLESNHCSNSLAIHWDLRSWTTFPRISYMGDRRHM